MEDTLLVTLDGFLKLIKTLSAIIGGFGLMIWIIATIAPQHSDGYVPYTRDEISNRNNFFFKLVGTCLVLFLFTIFY